MINKYSQLQSIFKLFSIENYIKFNSILFCLLMTGFGYSAVFAQQNQDTISAVGSYTHFLDSHIYSKEGVHLVPNQVANNVKYLQNNELKHAAKLMFEAYDADPIRIGIYFTQRFLSIDSEKTIIRKTHPAFMEMKIQERIKTDISSGVYALVKIPYLLRIKVTNVKMVMGTEELSESEKLLRAPFRSKMTIVSGVVQSVYKGSGRNKVGNNIEFQFYNSWINHNFKFVVGNDYLVPLEPREALQSMNEANYKNIFLMYLDRSEGYYPIVDKKIADLYNLFGFGQTLNYEDFERHLKASIQEIKSW
ncbi:MAG: hypothetical protein WAV76_16645 [Bacteroidota bacterium]